MNIRRFVSLLLLSPISCVNAEPLVVDATENPIGFFLEHISPNSQTGWAPDATRNIHVSTPAGYLFNLETLVLFILLPGVDEIIPVPRAFITGYWLDDTPDASNSRHYESSDCSGQAFIPTNTTGIVTTSRAFSVSTSEIWYVPKDEVLVYKSFGSRRTWTTDGSCEVLEPARETLAARAFPNDSGATGVSNTEFDGPIRITSGLSSGQMSCIFKDGFECSK